MLKFDRTFFTGFENSERAKTVISGMIRLSKELGVKTVAEGVETKEAVDILHELGCDLVQGYYFSPPVPDEEYCLACREKSCYRSLNLTLTKL